MIIKGRGLGWLQENDPRLGHKATVLLHLCCCNHRSLLAYATIIAKASLKYAWLSWVVYNQNFRQEAAEQGLGKSGPKRMLYTMFHQRGNQH